MPPIPQRAYQCGPASLASVLRYWGHDADAEVIGQALHRSGARGVLNFTLAQYARAEGLWSQADQGSPSALREWLTHGIPPIVMLRVGPFGVPIYHFVVVTGFNDREQVYYANTGRAHTQAIRFSRFERRWRDAGYWSLLIVPAERVDWELEADQATELGVVLERTGRLDLAERWYRAALVDDPEHLAAEFNLANVYRNTNRLSDAKALYANLLKRKPSWAPAVNNLAWMLIEEGRFGEASRVIEDALARGAQRRYDLLDTLGLAYCRQHQTPRAREVLLEVLQGVPPDAQDASNAIRQHIQECAGLKTRNE